MKVVDEGGKEREVSDLKVITHHMTDDKGRPVVEQFVEYTVHGNFREWKDWCPLEVFRRNNPSVTV